MLSRLRNKPLHIAELIALQSSHARENIQYILIILLTLWFHHFSYKVISNFSHCCVISISYYYANETRIGRTKGYNPNAKQPMKFCKLKN